MSDPSFSEVKACVFDAFGTLFDVHSAANRMKDELGENVDKLSEMWRFKQLQYTWLRSLMGQHEDFWQVTGDALDYSMRALDMSDDSLRAKLMELYLQLDAYPEVVDVLTRLKDGGKKTAILSNGEPSMLVAAAKNANIYSLLDKVLSVEKVGIFKPHPSTYQIAVDELKFPANHICFQSSNCWDAHGAAAVGFMVTWVNRFEQPHENLPSKPHAEIKTLSDLLPLLKI
ncbi:MAG: (S)-2-haloacid dehalogenase 4A [Alphaproteobacteria bacterium MarineAlpha11_Bin1]|nr:MAG: (S)-2-haloacid dehalogenase 4A [Alphaproteobacteria bacterium MarineAlpha11_Bin1]|tara:strand:- start:3088 stop:3774 length:687 start_codon:yes stop_codon:yes gene_type:complete